MWHTEFPSSPCQNYENSKHALPMSSRTLQPCGCPWYKCMKLWLNLMRHFSLSRSFLYRTACFCKSHRNLKLMDVNLWVGLISRCAELSVHAHYLNWCIHKELGVYLWAVSEISCWQQSCNRSDSWPHSHLNVINTVSLVARMEHKMYTPSLYSNYG